MEILIGVAVAFVAWLLWNGMRPPGATVKSSLERKRRRDRTRGGSALKAVLVLVGAPALSAVLVDLDTVAAPLLG